MWASAMESKRYPIVVFNPSALSNPSSTPVGIKYHLTFKVTFTTRISMCLKGVCTGFVVEHTYNIILGLTSFKTIVPIFYVKKYLC